MAYRSQTADFLNQAVDKRERIESKLHNNHRMLYSLKKNSLEQV
jgi:hypothetical protein